MNKKIFKHQTAKDSGYYFHGNILEHQKSQYQDLKIIDNLDYGKTLLLDDKVMLTVNGEHEYHELIIHPSCLQLNEYNNALVIGGGDCFAVKTLLYYPFKKVDMVELDKAVVDICKVHFKDELGDIFTDSRLEIHYQDAFKFCSGLKYDYIALDLTDPDMDISSSLYSEEALKNIKGMMSKESILAIQCASPFEFAEVFENTLKTLSMFKYVAAYGKYMTMYGTYQYFIYCSDHFNVSSPDMEHIKKNIELFNWNNFKIYSPEYHQLLLEEYKIHARIKSQTIIKKGI